MRLLAIDTSSAVASAAILEDNKLVAEYILNNKKTHSQKIMPMVEELMRDSELEVSDIDIFAAAYGPGSFTGLRIGVATAKALAHAVKKPMVEVSTLEGIAYNALYSSCLLCPIMDARRSQVYNAVYRNDGEVLKEVVAPRAISLEECVNELKLQNEKVLFMGDGVAVHMETIKEMMGEQAMFAKPPFLNQRASSIAQIAYAKAQKGSVVSYLEFAPFYLRKSQAEREREEKLKAEQE